MLKGITMILDHYIEQDQESRKAQALDARDLEADKNCEFEAIGRKDFLSGSEPNPDLVLKYSYRNGYQNALWSHYCHKYGLVEEIEF